MKRVEIESFSKSFLLFFLSLNLLTGTLFYFEYQKEQKGLDETLFSQMKLCSYDLKCDRFAIDFTEPDGEELYTLYKDDSGLYAFFSIPNTTRYVMKFGYSKEDYRAAVTQIREAVTLQFLGVALAVAVLSALFSLYALYPLRNALKLTEEFIKDILHDFNTPLSVLRLNAGMLKREIGENEKLGRIEKSVETVLNLQENLRSYLAEHALQKDVLEMSELLDDRIRYIRKLYPQIGFERSIEAMNLYANRDALVRIFDNLLSNAAKYNTKTGRIEVTFERATAKLCIKDTGKGIKEPKKIFERFYTEDERGTGIGLHIVKKLCDEMDISIRVESKEGVGSTFTLDLSALTHH